MVEEYKYLSVHLDNRLDWRLISEAIYKKSQSRLYFLRKLGSFNKCVVESLLKSPAGVAASEPGT